MDAFTRSVGSEAWPDGWCAGRCGGRISLPLDGGGWGTAGRRGGGERLGKDDVRQGGNEPEGPPVRGERERVVVARGRDVRALLQGPGHPGKTRGQRHLRGPQPGRRIRGRFKDRLMREIAPCGCRRMKQEVKPARGEAPQYEQHQREGAPQKSSGCFPIHAWCKCSRNAHRAPRRNCEYSRLARPPLAVDEDHAAGVECGPGEAGESECEEEESGHVKRIAKSIAAGHGRPVKTVCRVWRRLLGQAILV